MKKLKGSLTIEAALVLPIFLFALFSLVYLIKVIYIHEQVQYAITEAANEMAIGAYVLDRGGLLDIQQETYNQAKGNLEVTVDALETVLHTIEGLTEFDAGFEEKGGAIESHPSEGDMSVGEKLDSLSNDFLSIKDQIETEIIEVYGGLTDIIECIQVLSKDSKQMIVSLGVVPGMEVMNNVIGSKITAQLVNNYITLEEYSKWHIINGKKGMDYSRSSFLLKDDDICIVVHYQIEIPFLRGVIEPINMTQAVKTRAFTGNGNFVGKHEQSVVNEEDKSVVYITKKGTKYHTIRSCRYIDVKIKETTYESVKEHKSICEVCAKEKPELNPSTIVYSTDASDIFHTSKNCWTIKREVISVTEEEALENGYTLCSKCKEEETK